MPAPESVEIEQQPESDVMISDPLDLICSVTVNKVADTPFSMSITWFRESTHVFAEILNSASRGPFEFNSTLSFESLEHYQMRNYTCHAVLDPRGNSTFWNTVRSDGNYATTAINASMLL